MIEFDAISKTLGDTPIIRRFSMTIATGEAVCLCGPSGIGKTTLLEIGAGLLVPDSGTVHRNSESIGCAFQDDVLVPWLTASENIDLALASHPDRTEATTRHWLERFELPPDMVPPKMSGGMRRRLCLARAFAVTPKILLLDEPFAFLDDNWQDIVADTIAEHRQNGNAILLVSHQLRHIKSLACRMIHITQRPITHAHN